MYLLLKYLDRQFRTWHLVRSTLFAVHSAVFKHINKQIAKWICSNFRTNIVMTSGAPIHRVNNYAVLEISQTNLKSLLTNLFFPRKKLGERHCGLRAGGAFIPIYTKKSNGFVQILG